MKHLETIEKYGTCFDPSVVALFAVNGILGNASVYRNSENTCFDIRHNNEDSCMIITTDSNSSTTFNFIKSFSEFHIFESGTEKEIDTKSKHFAYLFKEWLKDITDIELDCISEDDFWEIEDVLLKYRYENDRQGMIDNLKNFYKNLNQDD